MALALRQDADAHTAGRYDEIATRYDDVYGEVLALSEWTPRLGIAFEFWDCWNDARNHDWRYYEGIGRDDWPKMAQEIAAALESGDEIDATVVDRFGPQPRRSLRQRLSGLVKRVRTDR